MKYKLIALTVSLASLLALTGCSDKPTAIMAKVNAQSDAEAAFEYLQVDNVKAARYKLYQGIKADPTAAAPRYTLAYLEEATGHMAQAEKDYLKAISFNPKAGPPHNNYGTFLCHENRVNDALKQFELAIKSQNYYDTATAYENAGLCAMKTGKQKLAKNYFIEAVNTNPYLKHSLFELALISYYEKEYDNAKQYLTQYLTISKSPDPFAQTLKRYLKSKPHPMIKSVLPIPTNETKG